MKRFFSWLRKRSIAQIIADVLALAFGGFMIFFIVAHAFSPEGLPPIHKFSLGQHLTHIGLLLTVLGSLIGWKWRGTAALMILVGIIDWHVFACSWAHFHFNQIFLFPLIAGVLYSYCWWRKHPRS
jgi:hypothetical protein